MWGGRGMSGQNDRSSKGLSLAQPITPQWTRKKSMGQTKRVHKKMQLWKTWNCQQISSCPNSEICQPSNTIDTEEESGDDSTHRLISKYEIKIELRRRLKIH